MSAVSVPVKLYFQWRTGNSPAQFACLTAIVLNLSQESQFGGFAASVELSLTPLFLRTEARNIPSGSIMAKCLKLGAL